MTAALPPARLLVVDDQAANVMLLEHLLARWGYHDVVSTTDSAQVVDLCREQLPDLVLLDLHMPDPDGFEILRGLEPWVRGRDRLPVIVLTADVTVETRRRALSGGARDFLTKPLDAVEVELRVANVLETRRLQLELQQQAITLEQRVEERTRILEHTRRQTLERLALAGEYRDDETHEHALRVGRTAGLLARGIGMPETEVEAISRAAQLHDIGKIGLPDAILLKTGRLTPDEFELMTTHAVIGEHMLAGTSFALLEMSASIALTHHERFDGSGYPQGLAGEEIPLVGRLVAVADVFDALTHDRPYKAAWPVESAVGEIRSLAGTHFDPALVDAFLKLDPMVLMSPAQSGTLTTL